MYTHTCATEGHIAHGASSPMSPIGMGTCTHTHARQKGTLLMGPVRQCRRLAWAHVHTHMRDRRAHCSWGQFANVADWHGHKHTHTCATEGHIAHGASSPMSPIGMGTNTH